LLEVSSPRPEALVGFSSARTRFSRWGAYWWTRAIDRGVVHRPATRDHQFCAVAVAERGPEIPAHAQHKDFRWIVPPWEGIFLRQCRASAISFFSYRATLTDRFDFCNRAAKTTQHLCPAGEEK